MAQFSTFFGSRVTVRRADGALVTASVNLYPPVLYVFGLPGLRVAMWLHGFLTKGDACPTRYEFVGGRRWEEAVRLCRFVKSKPLWTCLAGMSLHRQHLDTAEIALAAIDQVDKLHYILHVKDIPSSEGRNAAMALFRRSPDEVQSWCGGNQLPGLLLTHTFIATRRPKPFCCRLPRLSSTVPSR